MFFRRGAKRFEAARTDCEGGIFLSQAKADKKIKILSVEGCGHSGKRLCELGFMCSRECTVLRNEGKHPVIIDIDGGSFAIGRGLASKIRIEYVD